jgi:2-keto-4-pentenoate hydratase
MTAVWDDPRVSRGMAAQLSARRKLLDAGHKPLGWKVAFGSPAAMQRLGIEAPLIGFLTDRALVASGVTLSLSDWTKPVLEPEIAVHLAADLPAGADRATASAAIGALGPAFELADVRYSPDNIEALLAGNINQRNVILGSNDVSRAGGLLQGLSGRVLRNGTEVANTSDVQELTGELIDIVRHVADMLAAFGETLQAGQIIIAGSIVPPLWVEAGEEVVFHLDPIDTISIRFAAKSSS